MRGVSRGGKWAALTGAVVGVLVGATSLARTAESGPEPVSRLVAEACAAGYHATEWREPVLSGPEDGTLARLPELTQTGPHRAVEPTKLATASPVARHHPG